ncbi:MAG: DUF3473 domain-containing protein [Ignavibacteriae bacterium]|nr:DUF3473 domain-containing protein [Ignavibacteriota bacterium]
MVNAISIDVEDWFCVYNLESIINKSEWGKYEYRADRNIIKILDLFQKYGVKGTFFILGWIADKSPDIIKEIENRGHEIGLHSYLHPLITKSSPDEFTKDVEKGLNAIIKTGIKQDIIGFRAPSFSLTKKTMWALDILRSFNIKYDSSVFPVGFHPDYGIIDAPLSPYSISDNMIEFPMTVAKVFGRRIPCSGGGYFRFYPYWITKKLLKNVNRDKRPAVFYLHPWEIDPGQPRVDLPMFKKFRHYNNLHKTEIRLEKLLKDFKFTTIKNILGF